MFSNTRRITIEWGDCDPAGIVFYPRYFEMFDSSTAVLLAAATQVRKNELLQRYNAVGFPLVAAEARFHSPCSYGDEADIESRIAHLGRSSFTVEHRLLRDGQLRVEAKETRVWVGRDPAVPGKIKAQPLPEEIVSALSREA